MPLHLLLSWKIRILWNNLKRLTKSNFMRYSFNFRVKVSNNVNQKLINIQLTLFLKKIDQCMAVCPSWYRFTENIPTVYTYTMASFIFRCLSLVHMISIPIWGIPHPYWLSCLPFLYNVHIIIFLRFKMFFFILFCILLSTALLSFLPEVLKLYKIMWFISFNAFPHIIKNTMISNKHTN